MRGHETMPLCIWCNLRFTLIPGHPLNDACKVSKSGHHAGL